MKLAQHIDACQQRLNELLEQQLPAMDVAPERLHRAMRYASLDAGKRLRPLLVYLAGETLGAKQSDLDASALAVECIHVYSLIHDDLPAMDDDELRRGKATCHIAFDEATAILAGDALQSLAFDILANHPLSEQAEAGRIELIKVLSKASGSLGMGGGQMIDLLATDQQLDIQALKNMHCMKTGALIAASVSMAVITSGIKEQTIINAMTDYADRIGLAFQVKDDILDIEGDTEVIGKPSGSDQAQNKSTFPALLGLEQARSYAEKLVQEALLSLQRIPYNTDALKDLAHYMINRHY